MFGVATVVLLASVLPAFAYAIRDYYSIGPGILLAIVLSAALDPSSDPAGESGDSAGRLARAAKRVKLGWLRYSLSFLIAIWFGVVVERVESRKEQSLAADLGSLAHGGMESLWKALTIGRILQVSESPGTAQSDADSLLGLAEDLILDWPGWRLTNSTRRGVALSSWGGSALLDTRSASSAPSFLREGIDLPLGKRELSLSESCVTELLDSLADTLGQAHAQVASAAREQWAPLGEEGVWGATSFVLDELCRLELRGDLATELWARVTSRLVRVVPDPARALLLDDRRSDQAELGVERITNHLDRLEDRLLLSQSRPDFRSGAFAAAPRLPKVDDSQSSLIEGGGNRISLEEAARLEELKRGLEGQAGQFQGEEGETWLRECVEFLSVDRFSASGRTRVASWINRSLRPVRVQGQASAQEDLPTQSQGALSVEGRFLVIDALLEGGGLNEASEWIQSLRVLAESHSLGQQESDRTLSRLALRSASVDLARGDRAAPLETVRSLYLSESSLRAIGTDERHALALLELLERLDESLLVHGDLRARENLVACLGEGAQFSSALLTLSRVRLEASWSRFLAGRGDVLPKDRIESQSQGARGAARELAAASRLREVVGRALFDFGLAAGANGVELDLARDLLAESIAVCAVPPGSNATESALIHAVEAHIALGFCECLSGSPVWIVRQQIDAAEAAAGILRSVHGHSASTADCLRWFAVSVMKLADLAGLLDLQASATVRADQWTRPTGSEAAKTVIEQRVRFLGHQVESMDSVSLGAKDRAAIKELSDLLRRDLSEPSVDQQGRARDHLRFAELLIALEIEDRAALHLRIAVDLLREEVLAASGREASLDLAYALRRRVEVAPGLPRSSRIALLEEGHRETEFVFRELDRSSFGKILELARLKIALWEEYAKDGRCEDAFTMRLQTVRCLRELDQRPSQSEEDSWQRLYCWYHAAYTATEFPCWDIGGSAMPMIQVMVSQSWRTVLQHPLCLAIRAATEALTSLGERTDIGEVCLAICELSSYGFLVERHVGQRWVQATGLEWTPVGVEERASRRAALGLARMLRDSDPLGDRVLLVESRLLRTLVDDYGRDLETSSEARGSYLQDLAELWQEVGSFSDPAVQEESLEVSRQLAMQSKWIPPAALGEAGALPKRLAESMRAQDPVPSSIGEVYALETLLLIAGGQLEDGATSFEQGLEWLTSSGDSGRHDGPTVSELALYTAYAQAALARREFRRARRAAERVCSLWSELASAGERSLAVQSGTYGLWLYKQFVESSRLHGPSTDLTRAIELIEATTGSLFGR